MEADNEKLSKQSIGEQGAKPKVSKPHVEEITLEQAIRVLGEKGFDRVIQVRREPETGRIIDLFLRE